MRGLHDESGMTRTVGLMRMGVDPSRFNAAMAMLLDPFDNGVAAVYDAAIAYCAEAGPLPIVGTEAWVEPLRDYGMRLQRAFPFLALGRLTEIGLEYFGYSEGIPRARLVRHDR